METPFHLTGKVILVTGASSGIGRAIAIQCSKLGARLIITGRNSERLDETLNQMCNKTEQLPVIADLNDEQQLQNLVDSLPELDGFVHCAGVVKPVLLKFIEKSDIDSILNTNTISLVNLTRLLVQSSKLKKKSSIVFISSINGNKCAYIGSTLYAGSKSFISGFMKALALELAGKQMRVNSIEPGMIETDLLENSAISKDDLEKDRLKYPLKRYGKPEEVAYAAIYLLSDATQWMTGSSIVLDGGFTLQ